MTVTKSKLQVTNVTLSQDYCNDSTVMGTTLIHGGVGATVKLWAPAAREIEVLWDYIKINGSWEAQKRGSLHRIENDVWVGFIPEVKSGEKYMFYVKGPDGGTEGLKRDPYARDLTDEPMWPDCLCILCDSASFPWHDNGFHPPAFHELSIYQFHIGTWFYPLDRSNGTFLDVITKLPYLKSLGINAIQPLPIVEFSGMFSLGYNGVDYFSPETDYGVKENDPELHLYLDEVNKLLQQVDPALTHYTMKDIIGTFNQFRMMIDMCHVFGLSVILDVVYNHAGGEFGDRSIYHFDRRPYGNHNESLYFTDKGWAGGLVFAYWNDRVKQFLIDNAKYFLTECHIDGFRYDEVSVIKNEGGEHGWLFCKYVTDTCHYVKPEAIHIAECWPVEQAVVSSTGWGGAGFDATQNDGLRDAVRDAVAQAACGGNARVDMDRIARNLASPVLYDSWRAVQCTENHDKVYKGRDQRIARLADALDSRSWYARSRSRVALGLTITSPGIPHIFMGQEFLEDKQWHDEPGGMNQIWWAGLEVDKTMIDFLRFTKELFAARNRLPGLRGSGLNVFHVHNDNRVIAIHRWIPGSGHDVVVVASLSESTYWDYRLGMPCSGYWREEFNSDVYDNWVNPGCAGNYGGRDAWGAGMHGLPHSMSIVIPAGSILIFAK